MADNGMKAEQPSIDVARARPQDRFMSIAGGSWWPRVSAITSVPTVDRFALLLCCCLAGTSIIFFLLLIKPLVLLRADILMWEETDFVSNIIKLNIGAPLYTAPADGNSLIYNPLAFVLTYVVAWPAGLTRSVAGLRSIQLGYVVLAALLATVCCRKLTRLAFSDRVTQNSALWAVLTFLSMFLAATSPYVNRFVYTLHVDAVSLLVSIFSFWSMLNYVEKRSVRGLLLMSLCPVVGFLTKQFLVGWIGVMAVMLLILDPSELKRLAAFLFLSSAFALAGFLLCYALWGENYYFWTVRIMGGERKAIVFSPDSYSISILRGVDHVIRAWPAIFTGVIGGWALLIWGEARKVGPLIAAWVVLIMGEGLSSGAGWSVLYHLGPGVVIAAILIFAAMPRILEKAAEKLDPFPRHLRPWMNVAFLSGSILAIFMAWHVVPTGDPTSPRYVRGTSDLGDVERYVSNIENEFAGLRTERVLIGVGSWIYLRDCVLQKDRAVALADQPFGGIYENFDVAVNRLRERAYDKILVQDFHSPHFLYDWADWPRPSGFRDALSENYIEIRLIEPPKGGAILEQQILNAGPVSVFVPRN